MPVGIHTITLAPGVRPEEFEQFMADELLPAAKTVIASRMGMVTVNHPLVKSKSVGEGNPGYAGPTLRPPPPPPRTAGGLHGASAGAVDAIPAQALGIRGPAIQLVRGARTRSAL